MADPIEEIELSELVAAAGRAFAIAPLPSRLFRGEKDLEAQLWPSMREILRTDRIEMMHSPSWVACFMAGEVHHTGQWVVDKMRRPDGEARRNSIAVALELKLFRDPLPENAIELRVISIAVRRIECIRSCDVADRASRHARRSRALAADAGNPSWTWYRTDQTGVHSRSVARGGLT